MTATSSRCPRSDLPSGRHRDTHRIRQGPLWRRASSRHYHRADLVRMLAEAKVIAPSAGRSGTGPCRRPSCPLKAQIWLTRPLSTHLTDGGVELWGAVASDEPRRALRICGERDRGAVVAGYVACAQGDEHLGTATRTIPLQRQGRPGWNPPVARHASDAWLARSSRAAERCPFHLSLRHAATRTPSRRVARVSTTVSPAQAAAPRKLACDGRWHGRARRPRSTANPAICLPCGSAR